MLGAGSSKDIVLQDNINLKLNELLNKKKKNNNLKVKTNIMTKARGQTVKRSTTKGQLEIQELKKQLAKLSDDNQKLRALIGVGNDVPNQARDDANYFAPLMEVSDETDNMQLEAKIQELTKRTKEKKNNNINHEKTTAASGSQKVSSNVNLHTSKRMPPINFGKTDVKLLRQLLGNELKIKDFLIKQIGDNNNVLYTYNTTDFKKARALLEKSSINYYTFTPKEDKKVSLVLKGLNTSYSCEEVLENLKQFENENIKFEKVTRFTTKFSTSKGKILPFFIVQASPRSPINEILKIKSIDHLIIK